MNALFNNSTRRITAILAVFFLSASTQGVVRATEASRVRVLIVVDMTGDAPEKQRRAKNRDLVRAAIVDGMNEQGLQKRYTMTVYQSDKATPDGVLNYFKNLKTDSSETLFCYVNSHGGGDANDRHYMVLGKKKLYHDDLRAAMQARNPGLAVLVTEACYSLKGSSTAPAKAPAPMKQDLSKEAKSGQVLRQLLFEHRGLVDIQSAKAGNLARGFPETGNMFTRTFAELLRQPVSHFDRNHDGFVDWSEFYTVVRRDVIQVRRDENQPPLAFSLAKKAA
jgi:hypothetical protein